MVRDRLVPNAPTLIFDSGGGSLGGSFALLLERGEMPGGFSEEFTNGEPGCWIAGPFRAVILSPFLGLFVPERLRQLG